VRERGRDRAVRRIELRAALRPADRAVPRDDDRCQPRFLRRGESVYDTLEGVAGVELLGEPQQAFWGGGFSWRDPEGNVWDVAWAKGTTIDDRGGVHFP
jgi:hypothetical protein